MRDAEKPRLRADRTKGSFLNRLASARNIRALLTQFTAAITNIMDHKLGPVTASSSTAKSAKGMLQKKLINPFISLSNHRPYQPATRPNAPPTTMEILVANAVMITV